jgi:hypothetical protein
VACISAMFTRTLRRHGELVCFANIKGRAENTV